MPRAKILLIEDNEADIHLLRLALDEQGEEYELEILNDGEEAFRFIEDHRNGKREPEPCVILLDLHLPRYNGMAILHQIREAPALEHIQILVLSGLVNSRHEAEITGLGAFFRQKPSTLDELSQLAAEVFVICKKSSPAISAVR